jgi:hypothetical protein
MVHHEHTQDPTGGHERHEQNTLHKPPKANTNKLTLVLSTPSFKGAGQAPRFGLAP